MVCVTIVTLLHNWLNDLLIPPPGASSQEEHGQMMQSKSSFGGAKGMQMQVQRGRGAGRTTEVMQVQVQEERCWTRCDAVMQKKWCRGSEEVGHVQRCIDAEVQLQWRCSRGGGADKVVCRCRAGVEEDEGVQGCAGGADVKMCKEGADVHR